MLYMHGTWDIILHVNPQGARLREFVGDISPLLLKVSDAEVDGRPPDGEVMQGIAKMVGSRVVDATACCSSRQLPAH